MTQPYDLSEVWTKLKKGDSMIATQMMDTFIARNPANVPPNFKKGDRIVTYVKVLEVFTSDSIAQLDNQRVQKEWLQKEVAFIEKYLSDKKVPVTKTPSGAFVEIINPGTGNLIDSGNYLTLNYTGTSWSGKVFDSNTDTAFHHTQPYSFVTGIGQMIKGFDEAMRFLRKGAVAKLYIPSTLGYGGNPNSPDIKPYEHLFFDIEILNVQEKRPDQPANLLNQQKVDATQPKN
jgi:FKBP-type peptidyl-prolyl cis-trans isomerase